MFEDDVVVLASRGGLRGGKVGQLPHGSAVFGLGGQLSRLRPLHLHRKLAGAVEQLLPLTTVGFGNLLAEHLLLSPELLEGRDGSTPYLVCDEDLVDQLRGRTAAALRLAGQLGVVSENAQINHRARVSALEEPVEPILRLA